jgi:hypothetical protein
MIGEFGLFFTKFLHGIMWVFALRANLEAVAFDPQSIAVFWCSQVGSFSMCWLLCFESKIFPSF